MPGKQGQECKGEVAEVDWALCCRGHVEGGLSALTHPVEPNSLRVQVWPFITTRRQEGCGNPCRYWGGGVWEH